MLENLLSMLAQGATVFDENGNLTEQGEVARNRLVVALSIGVQLGLVAPCCRSFEDEIDKILESEV